MQSRGKQGLICAFTTQVGGEHHEVIPNHSPLKLGTLRGILRSVASHHQLSVDELALKIGL